MNCHLGHIPVSLNLLVINRNWNSYFRTFIALKYAYSNVAFFESQEKAFLKVNGILNISDKTFKRHLNKLVEIGFLGIDKKQSYYIRSYNHLKTAYELKKTRKVEFTLKDLDKGNFTAYLYGSTVGYIALKKQNRNKWEVLKKGGINQSRKFLKYQKVKLEYTPPLSSRYLEFYIKASKSQINKQLINAKELGYIHYEKHTEFTGLTANNITHVLRLRQGKGAFPYCSGGFIYISHSNKFKAILSYKRENR